MDVSLNVEICYQFFLGALASLAPTLVTDQGQSVVRKSVTLPDFHSHLPKIKLKVLLKQTGRHLTMLTGNILKSIKNTLETETCLLDPVQGMLGQTYLWRMDGSISDSQNTMTPRELLIITKMSIYSVEMLIFQFLDNF